MIGDRLKLIGAMGLCAVFLSATVILFFHGAGLARKVDGLTEEIEAPITGYRDRLAACRATSQTLESQLAYQSQKVAEWQAEADRIKAEGEKATRAAQDRARTLERQLVGARRAQPRPGETVCEAADRLIVERVG